MVIKHHWTSIWHAKEKNTVTKFTINIAPQIRARNEGINCVSARCTKAANAGLSWTEFVTGRRLKKALPQALGLGSGYKAKYFNI